MKHLVILVRFLGLSEVSKGSTWFECKYQFKVVDMAKQEVQISNIIYIGGNGFGGDPGKPNCMQEISDKKIPLEQVDEGKELLKKDQTLHGTLKKYFTVGPGGRVTGTSWVISHPNKVYKKRPL